MEARYRSTLWACCFANFFQAVGSCFAILYVPLRGLYGLSFTDFGILVSLNFITQVASDVLFSKPVEKYGFRPFAVAAPLVSAAGLGLFAAAPLLFPQRPFAGFCAGMFLFAAAGGLQELLLSPILDALPIPEERKARSMSMLHSFFAWGQIFVVLATTGLLAVWGAARWQWIVLLWAAPPVAGAVLFCRVPLARKNGGAPPLPLRALARKGVFYALLAAIVLGGAAEVTMAQWASAFLEKGLRLPKLAGDVWGVCFFSLMLALGRSGYAALGARVPLHRLLIGGSGAAAVLYVVCALAQSPLLGVLACGLTGLCVSLLWPGAIILASRRIPSAGAAMFALLSAGGDVGASLGAFCVGRAADWAQASGTVFAGAAGESGALRAGLLLAAVFRPAAELTLPAEGGLSGYSAQIEEQADRLRTDTNDWMKLVIEEQCAAYVMDKAAELGITCQVRVTCTQEEAGVFLPRRCSVTGDLAQEEQEQLVREIQSDLDIPAQRQEYIREESP